MPRPSSYGSSFTVGDAMKRLLPRLINRSTRHMPMWPPDMFCLCASVLQLSGAYSLIVHEDHAPAQPWERQKQLAQIGAAWAREIKNGATGPNLAVKRMATLNSWWEVLVKHFSLPLVEFLRTPRDQPVFEPGEVLSRLAKAELQEVVRCLFDLLSVSDEMSADIKFVLDIEPRRAHDSYRNQASRELVRTIFGHAPGFERRPYGNPTLCREIHPSRAAVLPKVHTPRSGLTIRSLSNHLAYLRISDMHHRLALSESGLKRKGLALNEHVNILVVPWPPRVAPKRFHRVASIPLSELEAKNQHLPRYGLFAYEMEKAPPIDWLKKLWKVCQERAGSVHGLVFPEMALHPEDCREISDEFLNEPGGEDRFIIAGVGTDPAGITDPPGRFPEECVLPGVNQAVIHYTGTFLNRRVIVEYTQGKHHRWKIDGSQIVQYGLGACLHPNVDWWEYIRSGRKTLAFMALRPWLTTSVLICEDLARPDPVGDTLRAVGPNLIVSLLQDGPQLQGRWPGRYATALADDPGSSVLTVTSLGMAKLSRPAAGVEAKSQCIALWKDAKKGITEINIPDGADAVLLSLSPDYMCEVSADGRHKGSAHRSAYPVLTGILPIWAKDLSDDS